MQTKILEISNLEIGYKNKTLCENISTSVEKGSLVLLLGANGKGKSTLLKTISKGIPPLSGDMVINQKHYASYTLKELAKTISFSSISNQISEGITVRELLSFARIPYKRWFQKTTMEDWDLIDEIAKKLKVLDLLPQTFETLSDGQKQKINIARCLVQQTPIILLDEPTAHLDIVNKQMVFKLLKDLSSQGKTIICTTHDIHDASVFADQFWVIDKKGEFHDSKINGIDTKDELIAQMF